MNTQVDSVVSEILAKLNRESPAALQYFTSDFVNVGSGISTRTAEVYVDQIAPSFHLADLGVAIGKVIVHELGHNIGLPHTYEVQPAPAKTARLRGFDPRIDIMAQAFAMMEGRNFNMTRNLARMGLGADWTFAEGKQAVSLLDAYRRAGIDFAGEFDHHDILPGDIDPGEPVDPTIVIDAGLLRIYPDLESETAEGDFGIVPFGETITQQYLLFNVGDRDLTIRDLMLDTADGAFSTSNVPKGTVIRPRESLPIEISFHAQSSGLHGALLSVETDGLEEGYELPLVGLAQSPFADIRIELPTNNLGASDINEALDLRERVAKITNIGAQPLVIYGIRTTTGADQISVVGLPSGFRSSNPIILEPGENFDVDLALAMTEAGLQIGEIEIISNDPDHGHVRFPVIVTAVDPEQTAELGNNYAAFTAFIDDDLTQTQRAISDADGFVTFAVLSGTEFEYIVFDPATGQLAVESGDTDDEFFQEILVDPMFGISDSLDSDMDGLPDEVDAEVVIDDVQIGVPLEPGIVVTPSTGLVTSEGGAAAQFDIYLTAPPTDTVSVRLFSSNSAEGVLSIGMVTFTPADWNVPQTITVAGVDDPLADGEQSYRVITAWATSLDPRYRGIDPADVLLINLDNELPDNLLAGDYNRDGEVNAADYSVYRRTLGTSVTPWSGADGNGNGVVDTEDYQVWRSNYGAVASQVQQLPLAAELTGDFNGDGQVDAADYIVYRGSPAASVAPYSGADGNGNGLVEPGDYGLWKNNFGAVAVQTARESAFAEFSSNPHDAIASLANVSKLPSAPDAVGPLPAGNLESQRRLLAPTAFSRAVDATDRMITRLTRWNRASQRVAEASLALVDLTLRHYRRPDDRTDTGRREYSVFAREEFEMTNDAAWDMLAEEIKNDGLTEFGPLVHQVPNDSNDEQGLH